jgi:predicted acetyltransferase
MPNTIIRQLEGDEMLDVRYGLNTYAFRASPPLVNKTEWKETVRGQKGFIYLALFEDEIPAAAAATTRMTQQVRGALFPAGGVWGVATAPGARRKGYARRVLERLFAADRQDGAVFSCLYPFRESFYERLGYVTFPLPRTARFSPHALAPLLKKDLGGKVELLPILEGYDIFRSYLAKLRQSIHGMLLFDQTDPSWAQHMHYWLALAKVNGEITGMLLYALKGDAIAEFELQARYFYATTSLGKYLLLQWIALHADQTNRVRIDLPPFEQPETWLSDMQVKTESVARAPMGRVLDVALIGGMHTGPGSFTARLSDPFCPWNEGNWRFETVDGRLQVRPVESAACDLSIQALSGLVYGCHNPADFAIRGWGSPALEVQQVMRTMFPPLIPFMHEEF